MNEKIFKFLIVGEGTSDAALEHPIRWLLNHHKFHDIAEFEPGLDASRGHCLSDKVSKALKSSAPDILFVHRDGDKVGYDTRESEIDEVCQSFSVKSAIPVIPVKMLESWLLIDELAIRRAAGNPLGKVRLNLPRVNRLEDIADPKSKLFEVLRDASEYTGRRLKKFNVYEARRRVAEEVETFETLLALESFLKLSNYIRNWVEEEKS